MTQSDQTLSSHTACLDWWRIDEIALTQHPLRAVGDALCRLVENDAAAAGNLAESFARILWRMGNTCRAAAKDAHTPAVQLSMLVAGIGEVNGFNRRTLLEGSKVMTDELPLSQDLLGPDPAATFRQVNLALDLLAIELGQRRLTLNASRTVGALGDAFLQTAKLRQQMLRATLTVVPAEGRPERSSPRGKLRLV